MIKHMRHIIVEQQVDFNIEVGTYVVFTTILLFKTAGIQPRLLDNVHKK